MRQDEPLDLVHVLDAPGSPGDLLGCPTWIKAFHFISRSYDKLQSDMDSLVWLVRWYEKPGDCQVSLQYMTRAIWFACCGDSERFRMYAEMTSLPDGRDYAGYE